MGAVGKSVVEYEDEKRPADDHSRTGLNAATISPVNPRMRLKTTFRRRATLNIGRHHPLQITSEGVLSLLVHPGYVAISARLHTHVATQTVQHGKTAQIALFGILPSGGTPRDEAAFSHGVARAVIAVGAM